MFATSPTSTSEVKAATTVGFFSGASKSPVKPLATPANPLRILVVDDQPSNRKLLRMRLSGHICFEAADGEQAVNAVKDAKEDLYDLIIMDVEMPNKDGKQATVDIRNLGYLTPIACFSSTVKDEKDLEALNKELKIKTQGMNDFISKTIKSTEIERIINKYSELKVSSPRVPAKENESTTTSTVTPFWSSTPPMPIPKAKDDNLGSFGIAPMSPSEGPAMELLENFSTPSKLVI